MLIIDASVALKWFLTESNSDEARQLLRGNEPLAAPDLLFVELANALWKKVRRGELPRSEAAALIEEFGSVGLMIVPSAKVLGDAFEIANATGRTVYDAVYIALAMRLDGIFVTADAKLVNGVGSVPFVAPHIRLLA